MSLFKRVSCKGKVISVQEGKEKTGGTEKQSEDKETKARTQNKVRC